MSVPVDSFALKYGLSCVAASVAESVTFPLDITKTRLQMQGEHASNIKYFAYRGMLKTGYGIVIEEGLMSLWRGLTPAILRHFVYTGCRMGCYEYLRDNIMKKNVDGYFPLWKSIIAGMSMGGLAQFLASPTDLVKVQMQMEGKRLLQGHKKRYKNTFHAFKVIANENGIKGLWKGWLPNVQRAALVNGCLGDLTTYDSVKHFLLRNTRLTDNWTTHGLSSICSGFVAAILSTPADVVKTRIMNNPEAYNGSMDCLIKAIQHEGFISLYKGFLPTWYRMAPWSLTFWLTFEQIRHLSGANTF
nr:mitochondrial uncoupling protein 4 [Hydra vulgaris]